jgi:hypothetical protein
MAEVRGSSPLRSTALVMPKTTKKQLSERESVALLRILADRFAAHPVRHKGILWASVEKKILAHSEKMAIIFAMEKSGGEPDVIGFDKKTGTYVFCDCSVESPAGRRSLCYDTVALRARKEHKPKSSVSDMASAIGITLLTEEQYRHLQTLGEFDTKTSSWIDTPESIRALGGALFADRRYGTVFFYHNGAESYYAARGFRGMVQV